MGNVEFIGETINLLKGFNDSYSIKNFTIEISEEQIINYFSEIYGNIVYFNDILEDIKLLFKINKLITKKVQ